MTRTWNDMFWEKIQCWRWPVDSSVTNCFLVMRTNDQRIAHTSSSDLEAGRHTRYAELWATGKFQTSFYTFKSVWFLPKHAKCSSGNEMTFDQKLLLTRLAPVSTPPPNHRASPSLDNNMSAEVGIGGQQAQMLNNHKPIGCFPVAQERREMRCSSISSNKILVRVRLRYVKQVFCQN